jgi:hypothetical protein
MVHSWSVFVSPCTIGDQQRAARRASTALTTRPVTLVWRRTGLSASYPEMIPLSGFAPLRRYSVVRAVGFVRPEGRLGEPPLPSTPQLPYEGRARSSDVRLPYGRLSAADRPEPPLAARPAFRNHPPKPLLPHVSTRGAIR